MENVPKIYFFLEEVRYHLKHKRNLRKWIIETADNENVTVETLNYIFTSDSIIFQLNKEYLRHYTLTDIITFDLSENEGGLCGDIYISIDRARENAREYHVSLFNEVCRLMIHGVLHLAGYKDKTKDEQVLMKEKEEYYLSLLPVS